MKTHDLSKKNIYPQKHRFQTNPSTFNLFSSINIRVGDHLLHEGVKLKVVKTEKIHEKANYIQRCDIKDHHSFYLLKVEEVQA